MTQIASNRAISRRAWSLFKAKYRHILPAMAVGMAVENAQAAVTQRIELKLLSYGMMAFDYILLTPALMLGESWLARCVWRGERSHASMLWSRWRENAGGCLRF